MRPMKKISIKILFVCLFFIYLFLAGCTVGPDYKKPEIPLPSEFKGNKDWKIAEPGDHLPKGQWWTIFNDPVLNDLENQAGEANQNLQAAAARVIQARAVAGISESDKYPDINANPSARRARTNLGEGMSNTSNTFSLPFDLSYELDLWGRVRRSNQASQADATASQSDYENVRLSLQADVARNYFQLRALDKEINIVERTTELRKESLRLVESRFKNGYISKLDLERAKTELASTKAEISALRKSRGELENALAVLLGKLASEFSLSPALQNIGVPKIAPTLPSQLLERRPDVARAERSVAAANARIGVAKAAFFPTIRINGSAGYQSSETSSLLDWDSRVWSLGPNISLPIFSGGSNRANLEKAKAAYDETVANYKQTVLVAFKEAEDGLSGLHHLKEQAGAQNQALESAKNALKISESQYKAGLISYLEVVDAQRTSLQTERASVQISGRQLETTVKLIKALGGGWGK
ncbi:efflux transporter outer membrane subunit [Desulfobacterales bacterium HSG17]|nr:efflux transporter outer membrane subunit [Desulfobacterales bacterium HSG17]